MGEISLITWLQASFVLLLVAIMGGAIGWGFGNDHAAKSWKKRMATREKDFQKHFKRAAPQAPLSWYWWTGREDRKEFIVGVVAHDEGEARMKLDPQRMPLLDKARASGVKEVGLHVLVAHSREEINVQAV